MIMYFSCDCKIHFMDQEFIAGSEELRWMRVEECKICSWVSQLEEQKCASDGFIVGGIIFQTCIYQFELDFHCKSHS